MYFLFNVISNKSSLTLFLSVVWNMPIRTLGGLKLNRTHQVEVYDAADYLVGQNINHLKKKERCFVI
jgi:hypothetical protein